MESNMENNIRFLIQREMLLSLLKNGEITQDEYDKTLIGRKDLQLHYKSKLRSFR